MNQSTGITAGRYEVYITCGRRVKGEIPANVRPTLEAAIEIAKGYKIFNPKLTVTIVEASQ